MAAVFHIGKYLTLVRRIKLKVALNQQEKNLYNRPQEVIKLEFSLNKKLIFRKFILLNLYY